MIPPPAFELPAEAPGVVEQRATVPTVPAWIPDPQKPQETVDGDCCPEPLHFGAVFGQNRWDFLLGGSVCMKGRQGRELASVGPSLLPRGGPGT